MYMLIKSKQMNDNIITLLIFEFWNIGLSIYMRYSIWKTRNVSKIHRSIPYNPRNHLDDGETEFATPFDGGVSLEHYDDWILH